MTKKVNFLNALLLVGLLMEQQAEAQRTHDLMTSQMVVAGQEDRIDGLLCRGGAIDGGYRAGTAAAIEERSAKLRVAGAELQQQEAALKKLEVGERLHDGTDDGRPPEDPIEEGRKEADREEKEKHLQRVKEATEKEEQLKEQHQSERDATEKQMLEIQKRFEEKREAMDEQQREADMQKLEEQKEKVRQMQAERQQEQMQAAELAREQVEKQAITYREASEREL
jgi:chromosome segregation ATPase